MSAPCVTTARSRISPTMTSPLALIAPPAASRNGVGRTLAVDALAGVLGDFKRRIDQARNALASLAPVPTGPAHSVIARSCPGMAGCGVHTKFALDCHRIRREASLSS